jgi:uncharacterized membrane protein YkoI
MQMIIRRLGSAAALLVVLTLGIRAADEKLEKVAFDKAPKPIQNAVNTRFPGADVTGLTKEKEGGKIVFDVELKHKGRKYEMDIHEDGTIVEIEKEVALKDAPSALAKTLDGKYPKAKIREVMEVNKVEGKVETPDHYEVTIETADGKKHEVLVSLDGKTIKGEE